MKGNNNSWACAIRGPITLITVGLLFVLNNFYGVGFDKTWPVLLIVFGLLTLLRRSTMQRVPPARGGFGSSAPPKPESGSGSAPSGDSV